MSNWFNEINKDIRPIFAAICQHDFIAQLTKGTLDKHIFACYIHQDSWYLSTYKKLLAEIATQCDDVNECQFYLQSAVEVTEVELELHKGYIESNSSIVISPTCELYTGFLANMTYTQPLAVAMAAVLPCFSIYQEVGEYILSKPKVPNNPYQDWINTYASEAFAKTTKQAIAITNRHAELIDSTTREKMNQAFMKAAKLEWMFWDSAFRQEQWAVI